MTYVNQFRGLHGVVGVEQVFIPEVGSILDKQDDRIAAIENAIDLINKAIAQMESNLAARGLLNDPKNQY
ncbi:Hypothetical protein NGAL_HAMBI490_60870 [Neorhizobium galegae bv. officinalis]|nr:Hypothetical protein NGAL_HAMBI490_60870 [Neorhizobium galegae bv. officinalis]